MKWYILRLREGLRWLFRGTYFDKLEAEIDRMAAPLAHRMLSDKRALKVANRIHHAISYLPEKRADKFLEMMARIGHPKEDSNGISRI